MVHENNGEYEFRPMAEQDAREIGHWKYEAPYSLYDIGDDPEDLRELLGGTYYAVNHRGSRICWIFLLWQ